MARIPDAELERPKSEISVERLIEAAGVALRPAGKDLLGCCTFHAGREASLVVTPSKSLWHDPPHVHLGSNGGSRVSTNDFSPLSDDDAKAMTPKQRKILRGALRVFAVLNLRLYQ